MCVHDAHIHICINPMSSSQNPIIVRHERTQAPYSKPNRPKPFSWNGRSTVLSQLPRKDGSHNQSGCPPTDQPDYPMMNLAAFWQQMLPSMPVLPAYPTHNHCIVNNLASDPHHGMEEVIGSIPIRSTNHLEAPPFRDFVAFLSQIPKPRREHAVDFRLCFL